MLSERSDQKWVHFYGSAAPAATRGEPGTVAACRAACVMEPSSAIEVQILRTSVEGSPQSANLLTIAWFEDLRGRPMANADNPGNGNAASESKDAAGQYRQPRKSSDNNGVASAKPRVTTGSDDATEHRTPPGQSPKGKDWDVNYDPADMNEGQFRG
jgi:hypothetical protein